MSISNPKAVNPATKFIEFKGDTGEFFYYDKLTEQKVQLKMPVHFVVLDELTSIKGYNQRLGVGIYSNEIRYVKDEILNVRSFKGGIQIVGKYQDIKDATLREGGKYCKSVYAMLVSGKDTYELVNFQFHGASFSGASDTSKSGWIGKKFNTEVYGVTCKETEQGQNGVVKFLAPVFEAGWKLEDKPEVLRAAVEMDKKLQSYLKTYLSQAIEKNANSPEELEPIEPEVYDPNDPTGMGGFEAEQMGYTKKDKPKMDVSDVNDLGF